MDWRDLSDVHGLEGQLCESGRLFTHVGLVLSVSNIVVVFPGTLHQPRRL